MSTAAAAGPGLELVDLREPAIASREAETAVVGAYLAARPEDRDAFDRVEASLDAPMLTDRRLGLIYEAARALRARGEPVEVITLSDALKAAGTFGEAGGYDCLGALVDAVPTAANVEYHARIVRDKAIRRQLHGILRAATLDVAGEEPIGDLVRDLEGRMESLQGRLGHHGPHILTLAEILSDPSAMAPPPVVVPRLAWAGRVTMLAAREKAGKSTLASASVAAAASGHRIFGETPPTPGRVLVVGLEEHVGDLGRRLQEFGADPDAVHVVDRLSDPLPQLEAAVASTGAHLTVVDTLAALVEHLDLDPGSSGAWTPVMTRLARIARDSGTALLVLHHARKEGGYRDSTAIGAGVDAILEMTAGDDGVRKLKAVGRWAMDDFSGRLVPADDGRPAYFELAQRELGVDAQVLWFVERNPGASKRQVRDGVRARASDVDQAVYRLLETGAICDQGTGNRAAFYMSAQESHGHATDTVGTRSGHASSGAGAECVPGGALPRRGSPPDTHPNEQQDLGERW